MTKWINAPIPRPRRLVRQEPGIVVILVVGVLATLLLIAVPFSISMVHHERGARAGLADAQAHLAAEGARAFAVHELYATNDFVERGAAPASGTPSLRPSGRSGGGSPRAGRVITRAPYDDPYVDARDELAVDVTRADRFPVPVKPPDDWGREFRTADPRGVVWGVSVEDEQGKVNLLTANDPAVSRVLSNLGEAIGPSRPDRRRCLTEYSLRPCRWIFPQNYRGFYVEPPPQGGSGPGTPRGYQVDDPSHYGERAWVRFTLGNSEHIARISQVHPPSGAFLTDPALPQGMQNAATTIEVEARHPVNVNTAPEDVLAALFEGIIQRDQNGKIIAEITRDKARAIARSLVASPVSSWTQFETRMNGVRGLNPLEIQLAILNAKDPTNRALGGQGSLPVCFRNEDVFSFEAWGAANDPAGNLAARRGFREVIELTPPEPMAWITESQKDFERTYSTFGTGPSPFRYPYGYPFGHRIQTSPRKVFAGEDPDPAFGPSAAAEVRLVPALDPWGSQLAYEEHYLGEAEGVEVTGGTTIPAGQILVKSQGEPDVQAGGVNYWFKLKSAGADVYFLDAATAEWENRLACFYRGATGELVLRACDATIERKAAEIRMPFSPAPDTWYHLSAHWKGTKFAHLALLRDGMSHPQAKFVHVDDQGRDIIGKLQAAIDKESTQIRVTGNGAANFPPTNGVVEIGQEAIEYDSWNGGNPQGVRRGTRGTGQWVADPQPNNPNARKWVGKDHVKDATVTMYGYANPFDDRPLTLNDLGSALGVSIPPVRFPRLTTGGATVTASFGVDTSTRIYKPPDPGTPGDPGGIDANVTEIPVEENGAQDFPKPGFLRIGRTEVVYYNDYKKGTPQVDPITGRRVTPDLFTGCIRGQLGTTATTHSDGTRVSLFSIAVTDNRNYLNPGFVQVDDEWFGPAQPASGPGGQFFTGLVVSGVPVPLYRGWAGTRTQAHGVGPKVIPVFQVRDSECGAWDRVTLIDAAGGKEEADVHQERSNVSMDGGRGVDLVALKDFTKAEYAVSQPDARVLKWPSGELLSTIPGSFSVGPSWNGAAGTFDGWIDEVKATSSNKGGFAAGAAADATQTQVVMNSGGGMADDGGIVKLGDEYVGYARRAGGTLDPAVRGCLDSPAAAHDAEERAFYLNYLPVGSLGAPASPDAPVLTLNGSPQNFRGREGFVLIDDEMIGFTSRGGRQISMPTDGAGRGLFRGAFGTVAAGHATDALVYGMPFRYWGFYKDNASDNKFPWWGGAMERPGAIWRRIDWTSESPDPLAELVVKVRFDGKPGWETPPSNRPGGIWMFTTPPGNLGVAAERIEVRAYFAYRDGAYRRPRGGTTAPDAWKHTPILRRMRVEYERESITRFHEEK